MRILHITYGLPWPLNSGARLRDFHLIRRVAEHHDVTVAALLETEDERASVPGLRQAADVAVETAVLGGSDFRKFATALLSRRPIGACTYHSPAFEKLLARVLDAGRFDLVQVEHSVMAPYLDVIEPRHEGATLLSMHNIAERQYRSMRDAAPLWRKPIAALKHAAVRRFEAPWARRFDAVCTVSRDDADALRSVAPDLQCTVIPNGVDTRVLRPLDPLPSEPEILFVGTLGYAPNRDGIRWFVRDVLPLIRDREPGCRLRVVGAGGNDALGDLLHPDMGQILGPVDDLIGEYRRARVTIAPLLAGGGSRLKIPESMALQRCVVSTPLGAEGLPVHDGVHLHLGDDPKSFSEKVLHLIRDDEACIAMARRARERVETHLDWESIAADLRNLQLRAVTNSLA